MNNSEEDRDKGEAFVPAKNKYDAALICNTVLMYMSFSLLNEMGFIPIIKGLGVDAEENRKRGQVRFWHNQCRLDLHKMHVARVQELKNIVLGDNPFDLNEFNKEIKLFHTKYKDCDTNN